MKEYIITFKPVSGATIPVTGYFYGNDEYEAKKNAEKQGFALNRVISVEENVEFTKQMEGHI